MEQNIKNFDRNIEQIMNEQQVPPPFGMWNRISAELETVPVAATTSPTSVIPKRAVVGIIAAALMIGATVTGYMVNSFVNKDKVTTAGNAVVVTKPAYIQTQPINVVAVVLKEPVKNKPVSVVLKKHADPVAVVKVDETKGAEETVTAVVTPALPVNLNTDVPTPIQPVAVNLAGENPTYYFPPVDMNIPEKTNKEKAGHAVAKTDDLGDDSDKRTQKVKFHPKKHTKFNYGKIIRNK